MAGQVTRTELDARLSGIARRLNEDGAAPWSFAPSLGVAWRYPAGPGVKSFLYQELRSRLVRRQPSLHRLPFLGALSLGRMAARTLRADRLDGPRLGTADSILVLGRSRTKLLDFEELTASAIEEPGKSTIPQERLARAGCGEFTTTDLIHVDQEDGVFVERLEAGFNLAVYGSAASFGPDVYDLLDRWRADRARLTPANEYIQTIELELGEDSRTEEWAQIRRAIQPIGEITLELSHGDLQPANVLVGPNGLRLVDFEHLGWRKQGYDMYTFSESLRWRRKSVDHSEPWLAAEEYRWRQSKSRDRAPK